jgi:hypothetical protein
MAWNPSPEVQVARDAAAKLGELAKSDAIQVAIIYVTADGRLGTVTYGKTKELCAETKKLGDKLYQTTYRHFEES